MGDIYLELVSKVVVFCVTNKNSNLSKPKKILNSDFRHMHTFVLDYYSY